MTRAVLSIGSNLGDRLGHLAGVLVALRATGATWEVSPVFETDPWPPGGAVPQDDYLNAVVVADDPGRDAAGWLAFVRAAEAAAGRVRDVRWGPRTLDVDVVQVTGSGAEDAVRSADPELTLPHPRAHRRAFVLVPWAALDPAAVLVGVGPVTDLLTALPDDERRGVRPRPDLTLLEVTAG